MTSSPSPPVPDTDVEQRVSRAIERAIQRNLPGLEEITLQLSRNVGLTPHDTIYARDSIKLYHYRPTEAEIYRIPLLVVTSLVSKPYILDLTPGQSLVEYLVQRGFDVYLLDWGIPRPEDKHRRIDNYVLDYLPEAVEHVLDDAGVDELSIFGYCMGGQMSLMYSALNPDSALKNLVTAATPINTEGMVLLRRWSDPRYFDVDRIVDNLGNVPPELLFQSFEMLRPAGRVAGNLRLAGNLRDDAFVKSFLLFDKWAADQVPFPGEAFRQMTKEITWGNKLYRNEFELDGQRVDLRQVTVPLLNVLALHDHIAPYDATHELEHLVGSEDKQTIALKGGHVSLVAGGNAVFRLWPQLVSWLAERSV